MTDPISSKYDPHPIDPNAKGDDSPPADVGNHQVPEVKVAWDSRPSFNVDATDIGGGGQQTPPSGTSDVDPFKVSLSSLATSANSMLTTSRSLVTQYEALKSKVVGSESTVFGQQSTAEVDHKYDGSQNYTPAANGGPGPYTQSTSRKPTIFADGAKQFAGVMNPHQEKALQQIGATLELVGEYIARVNHSGQVYAETDRHSKFPDPPASA